MVVLSFFATWCGPCKAELPHVEKELWQEFRARGITVIAVDREEPAQVIAPFVKQLGLTFPIVTDLDRKIYSRYATAYIPPRLRDRARRHHRLPKGRQQPRRIRRHRAIRQSPTGEDEGKVVAGGV